MRTPLLTAAVLLLAGCGGPSQSQSSPSSSPSPDASGSTSSGTASCAAYTFLGARGSGESFDDSDPAGFGVTGAVVATAAGTALGGTSAYEGVDYPAISVSAAAGDPSAALASVSQGIEETLSAARAAVTACPRTRLIAIGMSQGALVMHGFAVRVAGEEAIASRVLGVVLLGDPARDLDDADVADRGVHGRSGLLATSALDVPSVMRGRVLSVCLDGDEVCDPPAGAGWQDIRITLVHQIGYRQSEVVAGVTTWLGRAPRP